MSAAVRHFMFYLLLLCLFSGSPLMGSSNRTNNDPYPVYTALYPYTYCTNNFRDYEAGLLPDHEQEHFIFNVSPFRQAAVLGKNIHNHSAQLGDLTGRWNMISLFYPGDDDQNTNNTVQQTLFNVLGINQAELAGGCGNTSTGSMSPLTLMGVLTTPSLRDPTEQFGFFSVPIRYRKWGVRFQAEFYIAAGIGLQVQTGVCDIIQTTSFIDRTCTALGRNCPTGVCSPQCCDIDQIGCTCKTIVMNQIMDQYQTIAETLRLDIRNYNKRCAEDTRVNLYWRKVFPINQDREGWPYFLMMPFVVLEGLVPTGNKVNPNQLFALPGGNDGHGGLGFTAGLNFDFVETIEIGVQASMTDFFARNYCNYPVPVNEFQNGMLPWKANLRLQPATNWTFAALMNARNFLYRLSVWAQWVATYHGRDCFTNVTVLPFNPGGNAPLIPSNSGSTALPEPEVGLMATRSRWNSHMINVGLTYDISPNIALGFLWQTPVARQNAYRSTTLMGSLIVTW